MVNPNTESSFSDKKTNVCVIGGGVAGIAAAINLAKKGTKGVLIEARPYLGGRARSFEEKDTSIDNGQHIAMGCYTHFRQLLKTLGTEEFLQLTPALDVTLRNKTGVHFRLREASYLPPPLGFVIAVLRFGALSLRERKKVIQFAITVRKAQSENFEDCTAKEFLIKSYQSENTILWLWAPIIYATMNSSPEHASAKVFCEVLRRAFFAGGEASRLALPRTGLSELYAKPAQKFLEEHGWLVMTGAVVGKLEQQDKKISTIILRNGARISATAVILALPPLNCKEILPEEIVREIFFFDHYKPSPIVSVYLWLAVSVTDKTFEGFVGTTIQWLFNHTKLHGSLPVQAKQLLTFVASDAEHIVSLSSDNILALLYEELRECYPDLQKKVVHSLVIKEKRATFLPTPEAERHRPQTQTSIQNLFLAGDWTATGLPSTLEGAAQSGAEAAEGAMRYLEAV